MFMAGTETLSSTLRWSLIYMVLHPEVMCLVQEEIVEVVGSSRYLSINDRSSMPYTQAVILDIQRAADIVLQGMLHKTTEDLFIGNYSIPLGTVMVPFQYAAHRDPNIWNEPYKFKTEWFLDEQGNFCPVEQTMPFGIDMLSKYRYMLYSM